MKQVHYAGQLGVESSPETADLILMRTTPWPKSL